ncbi:MAG: hypothetical protein K2X87_06510 [Gemmataceae bacterium]|nr:hypothetical protein [Gemmataceae bacterium]
MAADGATTPLPLDEVCPRPPANPARLPACPARFPAAAPVPVVVWYSGTPNPPGATPMAVPAFPLKYGAA